MKNDFLSDPSDPVRIPTTLQTSSLTYYLESPICHRPLNSYKTINLFFPSVWPNSLLKSKPLILKTSMETRSAAPLRIRFKSSSFDSSSVPSSPSSRSPKKRTCLCSPTSHPGSFRCSIHKRLNSVVGGGGSGNGLYPRRTAVANSLMRLGTVDGYLLKRAVAFLIRPSSHQQRRLSGFQPRPTRLSVMSTANEDA